MDRLSYSGCFDIILVPSETRSFRRCHDRFDTTRFSTERFYSRVRPLQQFSPARATHPPDVSTMVEKIDFTKSGATNEARAYAETITLEQCKHTAKACGFITKEESEGFVRDEMGVRNKRTDLNHFFFTLGVASLSGLRKRFHQEKLPEPFPGLTPLLHDRVRAIPARYLPSFPHDSFLRGEISFRFS